MKAIIKHAALVMMALAFIFSGTAFGADPVVAKDKIVKIDYTLSVEGKVEDTTEGKSPIEVQIGSGGLIKGFEKNIMGLKAGGKKTFTVKPEDGYGKWDPNMVHETPKSSLPKNVTVKEGQRLIAYGPNKEQIPVVIVQIKENSVMMDFNHPLAGKTLKFDVKIVEIK